MNKTANLRWIWVLLVANGWATNIDAQHPKFRHFDASDGLPSATVYHIFQDSKEFLWFSTEAGVSRFDGTHWRHWTMDDGLPDNEVFGVFEDSKGRFWVQTFNGRLAFLENGRVRNAANTAWLNRRTPNDWVGAVYEVPATGHLLFAMQRDGLLVLLPNSTSWVEIPYHHFLRVANEEQGQNDWKTLSVVGVQAGAKAHEALVIADKGVFVLDMRTLAVRLARRWQQEVGKVYPFGGQGDRRFTLSHKDGRAFFTLTPTYELQPALNAGALGIRAAAAPFLKAGGAVWVGSLGDGVYAVTEGQPKVRSHYLKGKSVSWMLRDREGNFWFATLGDGVFMMPSNVVLTYTKEDGLSSDDLYGITGDTAGTVWVGTAHGAVEVVDSRAKTVRRFQTAFDERGYNRVNDIAIGRNGAIWAGTDLGLEVFGGRKTAFKMKYIKAVEPDAKGNWWIGSSEGLATIDALGRVNKIWDKRTLAVLPQENGAIWVGSNDGLYYYGGQEMVWLGEVDSAYGSRVAGIAQTQVGVVCVCTFGNGVLLKKGNRHRRITTRDGLGSNVCKGLFVDDRDNVWVVTATGLSKFRVLSDRLQVSRPLHYSEADNLASNDVRGVFAHAGRVWVTTSAGLSYFEDGAYQQATVRPPVYLSSLKIWERDTTILPTLVLPFRQNNLKIGYTGVSFRSGGRMLYQYKMEGIDEDWVTTQSTEVQYPALAPGKYRFSVKAIAIDGLVSQTPASIELIIEPPWWRTTWFVLMATTFVLVVTGGLVFVVIENNRQKDQLRRQIVESEQAALRAQMNPHFIFNALNSIQHFITMEDERSANFYLTKFARLVRKVLENSKRSFITLQEELETLQLYLEIETLRFDAKFSWKLDVSDEIAPYDLEIPSMIIQPFVENAIWHGLMPKQGDAALQIGFNLSENFLLCTVRDNGIGRKAAANLQTTRDTDHRSTGIDNTTRRLRLLSKEKDRDRNEASFVVISDLENPDGTAAGTLVTIRIPTVT